MGLLVPEQAQEATEESRAENQGQVCSSSSRRTSQLSSVKVLLGIETTGAGAEGALACAEWHLCDGRACQGMQQESQMEIRKL